MWLPNLADPAWLAAELSPRAEALGLAGPVTGLRVLDAQLKNPHRPDSPLCRGWATCEVALGNGPPALLYLRGFPDAQAAGEAWRRDRDARGTGRSRHLADLDVVVWTFPDDPRLPALPLLVDPARLARSLPAAARDVLGTERPRTTVVRYQPEASAVLRLEGRDGATVYAKHLADGVVEASSERHEALWSLARSTTPRLRIAEPLGVDRDLGVLWTRGVPGAPLTASRAADLGRHAPSVGTTLAALHATPTAAPALVLDELVAELDKKVSKITHVAPDLAPTLSRIVDRATERRAAAGRAREVAAHGDFHLDQLVASDGGPVLVDLDSMLRAAPEVDLGEFLVDLALRDLPSEVVRDVAGGLLCSYADAADAPVDPAVLGYCADAEFVNRCYRHLRRHAPGWPAALVASVARHDSLVALLPD